jgi:hypothetical protein
MREIEHFRLITEEEEKDLIKKGILVFPPEPPAREETPIISAPAPEIHTQQVKKSIIDIYEHHPVKVETYQSTVSESEPPADQESPKQTTLAKIIRFRPRKRPAYKLEQEAINWRKAQREKHKSSAARQGERTLNSRYPYTDKLIRETRKRYTQAKFSIERHLDNLYPNLNKLIRETYNRYGITKHSKKTA